MPRNWRSGCAHVPAFEAYGVGEWASDSRVYGRARESRIERYDPTQASQEERGAPPVICGNGQTNSHISGN